MESELTSINTEDHLDEKCTLPSVTRISRDELPQEKEAGLCVKLKDTRSLFKRLNTSVIQKYKN